MKLGKKLRAVVAGATGYSGRELIGLLLDHPSVQLVGAFASPSSADVPLTSVHPQFVSLTDLICRGFENERIRALAPDVVFLATPNEFSHDAAPELLGFVPLIVDVSGAFRLQDASHYPSYYGFEHHHPDLLAEAVYGLTEFARERLAKARLIANPGCYPTSVILPLLPLLESGLVSDSRPIICDSKSGVTGAGKNANSTTHFSEVTESFRAYNIFGHRHTPEIRQGLGLADDSSSLIFTPHLLPINRGILSTIYVRLNAGVTRSDVHSIWKERFATSPFVRVFAESQMPEIKFVANTPFADIGVAVDEATGQAVIVSAIDNLLKGAASQALQNANIALGLDEREGMLS
jgi:N-acetyl-gamma-glutamyl-phosphate reductase